MIKFIFLVLFGYILFKIINVFKGLFFSKKTVNNDYRVYDEKRGHSKINKKDVIDAQFEEIDEKENSSQKN